MALAPPRDLERELREQASYPPSWAPREGESIQGRVVRYSVAPTRFGRCHVVTLDTPKGRLAVWLSSAALLGQFRELVPRPGEQVGILYVGLHPEKKYKLWKVLVARDDQQVPDFSELGGEQEELPYAKAVMQPARQPASVGGRPAARLQADPFDE